MTNNNTFHSYLYIYEKTIVYISVKINDCIMKTDPRQGCVMTNKRY